MAAATSAVQFLSFLTTSSSSLPHLPTPRLPSTSFSGDRRIPAVALLPRSGRRRSAWVLRTRLTPCAAASSSSAAAAREGMSDPELRLVLELATDEELVELEEILFGPSYFSPLLKSIARRPDSDSTMAMDDTEERDVLISHLESRFLYLAADARSILRGWRPSYRNVLLGVRRKLGVPCSSKLSTADLEAEIFLHLLNEYSSQQKGPISFPWDEPKSPGENASLEVGLNKSKVLADATWRVGAKGFQSIFLKGGSALTLKTIYELLAKRLSGKLLLEAANYEIKNELIKQGGRWAVINLESRAALLAARQGLARAASQYLGLRSLMMFLGPLMWGTLLADVMIQMLGTDYARIVRAIYAFAQIRLTRTCYVASYED